MKIIAREVLAESQGARVVKIILSSPEIAAKALPGQFVVLMVKEEGERIPLTIVNADAGRGEITLIAQAAGLSTRLLAGMKAGESLYSLAGPLGHASEIKDYGRVILLGGGVGIAEIYPVAVAMKAAGNHTVVIIGARTKELLILEDELRNASDEMIVITDDGSRGRKGFVTEPLKELLEKAKYGLVYAVGPIAMMRAVSALTEPLAVKTVASLNALMVDATGMCGCCRVSVGGKVKFSCVDGPEFDAAEVDWQELAKRNSIYDEKEKHICRLNGL